MKINEKVSYIKGLAEGLEFDKTTKEGKLIDQIIESLEIISDELKELKVQNDELEEYITDLDEDLAELEDAVYDDEEADGQCGCCHHGHSDEHDADSVAEITCPKCSGKIFIDSDDDLENLECPSCAENITVTTVSECGCGCAE